MSDSQVSSDNYTWRETRTNYTSRVNACTVTVINTWTVTRRLFHHINDYYAEM